MNKVQWSKPVVATEEKTPAKKVGEWKTFEELIGFLKEVKSFDGQYGVCKYYYVSIANVKKNGDVLTTNEEITIRGASGLDNTMKIVKHNQLFRLTYLGKKKAPKSGMMFHDFEVVTSENYDGNSSPVVAEANTSNADSDFNDIDWTDD